MECARREDGRREEARSRPSSCARASRLLCTAPAATRHTPSPATTSSDRRTSTRATPRPQPRHAAVLGNPGLLLELASPCEQMASPAVATATVLELMGADLMGLISEVFAMLADMSCSVFDARVWSHRGRLACLVYLRDEDVAAAGVERIEARLAPLLRGDSKASGGVVAAVPAGSILHADRRLHRLMYASSDQEHAFPASSMSVESSAERGYSVFNIHSTIISCTVAEEDQGKQELRKRGQDQEEAR
ncbi:hypothetical protein ACQJBY_030157 [Aegilops geniculata]